MMQTQLKTLYRLGFKDIFMSHISPEAVTNAFWQTRDVNSAESHCLLLF